MPVLRQHNATKQWRKTIDDRNNFVSAIDCQGPSRAKVILHIDDQQRIAIRNLHRHYRLPPLKHFVTSFTIRVWPTLVRWVYVSGSQLRSERHLNEQSARLI